MTGNVSQLCFITVFREGSVSPLFFYLTTRPPKAPVHQSFKIKGPVFVAFSLKFTNLSFFSII